MSGPPLAYNILASGGMRPSSTLANASMLNDATAFRSIREQAFGSGAADIAETVSAMSISVRRDTAFLPSPHSMSLAAAPALHIDVPMQAHLSVLRSTDPLFRGLYRFLPRLLLGHCLRGRCAAPPTTRSPCFFAGPGCRPTGRRSAPY